MSTQPAATPAPVATPTVKVKGPKRDRQITRLVDNGGTVLEVIAEGRKDGTFQTSIKHTIRDEEGKVDREKSQGRGEFSSHATFDESKVKAQAAVASAVKLGYVLRASTGGGGAAKSNFTLATLPKPIKSAK